MPKLTIVAAALMLGATPALAQQRTYNIQVNESDLAALSKSLGKAPYEEVAPIIQGLGVQVQQQNQAHQTLQPVATPSQPVALQPKQDPQTSGPQPVVSSSMEADLKAKGKSRPSLPADYGTPGHKRRSHRPPNDGGQVTTTSSEDRHEDSSTHDAPSHSLGRFTRPARGQRARAIFQRASAERQPSFRRDRGASREERQQLLLRSQGGALCDG